MSGISFFHIVILLVLCAVVLAPMGYFGVARESSQIRLKRGRYAAIFLGCVAGIITLSVIADSLQWNGVSRSLSFAWLFIEFRLLRLTVQRLRDMERSRNYAYLCLIPWLGLLVHLFLCFPRSRGQNDAAVVEAF
jgi:uncharacterized membrane protein YhaH (DUF805 family)